MKRFVLFWVLFAIFVGAISCCDNERKVERPTPVSAQFRQRIYQDQNIRVYRNSYYHLDSVSFDTVRLNQNTLEVTREGVDNGCVDLNDYLRSSEDDETDYNATELSPEEWRYVESLGIYWNESTGCYCIK